MTTEYLNSIDTQSEVYLRFKTVRSERASYFFNDEKGIAAYKVAKRFNRFKNPILDYDGMHLCDAISMRELERDEWDKCVKVYINSLARRKRVKKRVNEFDGYIYFVTLTFSDEELKMTSLSRRTHIINPLLKLLREKFGLNAYVGVKEYGKKTDREHYHFIMCFDEPLKGDIGISMKHGKPQEFLKNTVIHQNYKSIVNVSELRSDEQDKLASYVAKVAGYLDKDTGKTQHLIYSSNFKGRKRFKVTLDENGFIDIPDEGFQDADLDFMLDIFGTL